MDKSYYLVRHLNNINTLVKHSKLNEHGTACKNKICKLDASIIITKAKFWLLHISHLVHSGFQTFKKNNRVISSTAHGAISFFQAKSDYGLCSLKICRYNVQKLVFSIETKLCITIKQLAYPN